jgi:hypothetical protein
MRSNLRQKLERRAKSNPQRFDFLPWWKLGSQSPTHEFTAAIGTPVSM